MLAAEPGVHVTRSVGEPAASLAPVAPFTPVTRVTRVTSVTPIASVTSVASLTSVTSLTPLGARTMNVRLVFRRGSRGFRVSGRTVFRAGAGFGFAPHTPAAKPSRAALHELVEHSGSILFSSEGKTASLWVTPHATGASRGPPGFGQKTVSVEKPRRSKNRVGRKTWSNPALGYMASSCRFGDIRKPGWLRLI